MHLIIIIRSSCFYTIKCVKFVSTTFYIKKWKIFDIRSNYLHWIKQNQASTKTFTGTDNSVVATHPMVVVIPFTVPAHDPHQR